MASDLFIFDSLFSDSFNESSTIDSHHEIYQSFQETLYNNQISSSSNLLLSSSPPSNQLESLSLYQNPSENFPNCSDFSTLEVKTEVPFENFPCFNNSFVHQGFGGTDNAVKFMQRSFSSNSFEGKKPSSFFQPCFDSVLESPNFSSGGGQMRRVCSTGDLQKIKNTQNRSVLSSSPLSTEGSSLMEESNFKVGKYSAEERKERIHRYRAKRTQRNFNKTIKYACRKTLADNRPRIRGRFARNDEAVEIPKTAAAAAMFNNNRYEDDDDLWIEGYNEEDDQEGSMARSAPFCNSFGSTTTTTHYQYYSY
ncbi:hypothetical protein M9H77_32635 [Catharanthus roseus]|uniref:Uncharacterized protein n=1 Tax=Catharanthus roseus TaxID=4058 RepID=A0ACC0A7Q1_CATRO|nr:hypothetical protein M9H77_32635 [Catharanthus roseus]